jgi:hypothetical protein
MDLVTNLSSTAPPDGASEATARVAQAYQSDPFYTMWALEGLGKYVADQRWRGSEGPRRLLTDATMSGLPTSSLPMLHAGAGMSFAIHLLDTVSAPGSAEIRDVLVRFLELCQENSAAGLKGAAIESLGLATRTLHDDLVAPIDRELGKLDQRAQEYFWHGVGRATYFLPVNFLPSCGVPRRDMAMVREEAPHEIGFLNALAGLSWALALVNIRQPQIAESFLKEHRDQITRSDAFASGVRSALMIRYITNPADPSIQPFCRHQPADAETASLWKEQITVPCEEGLREIHGFRSRKHRLDDLFRYRPSVKMLSRMLRGADV